MLLYLTHAVLSQVKVLYARNLTQDCTEEKLKEAFEAHGKVERVKKIKDYAFIHFEEREHAVKVSAQAANISEYNRHTIGVDELDAAAQPSSCVLP